MAWNVSVARPGPRLARAAEHRPSFGLMLLRRNHRDVVQQEPVRAIRKYQQARNGPRLLQHPDFVLGNASSVILAHRTRCLASSGYVVPRLRQDALSLSAYPLPPPSFSLRYCSSAAACGLIAAACRAGSRKSVSSPPDGKKEHPREQNKHSKSHRNDDKQDCCHCGDRWHLWRLVIMKETAAADQHGAISPVTPNLPPPDARAGRKAIYKWLNDVGAESRATTLAAISCCFRGDRIAI